VSEELEAMGALAGEWTTEAIHPATGDLVVHGTATFEWLEGHRFLIGRARNEHPDFPDSISVLGEVDGRMCMTYFDSRGVHRVYELRFEDATWRLWRDAPGFDQRFEGTLGEDGSVLSGAWEVATKPGEWSRDLEITYRREERAS
jgi:hypothetical protein